MSGDLSMLKVRVFHCAAESAWRTLSPRAEAGRDKCQVLSSWVPEIGRRHALHTNAVHTATSSASHIAAGCVTTRTSHVKSCLPGLLVRGVEDDGDECCGTLAHQELETGPGDLYKT